MNWLFCGDGDDDESSKHCIKYTLSLGKLIPPSLLVAVYFILIACIMKCNQWASQKHKHFLFFAFTASLSLLFPLWPYTFSKSPAFLFLIRNLSSLSLAHLECISSHPSHLFSCCLFIFSFSSHFFTANFTLYTWSALVSVICVDLRQHFHILIVYYVYELLI